MPVAVLLTSTFLIKYTDSQHFDWLLRSDISTNVLPLMLQMVSMFQIHSGSKLLTNTREIFRVRYEGFITSNQAAERFDNPRSISLFWYNSYLLLSTASRTTQTQRWRLWVCERYKSGVFTSPLITKMGWSVFRKLLQFPWSFHS